MTAEQLADLDRAARAATQEWESLVVTCCGLHYAHPGGGQHTSMNQSWAVGPPSRTRHKAEADAAFIAAANPAAVLELVATVRELTAALRPFADATPAFGPQPTFADYRRAYDTLAALVPPEGPT